MKGEQRTLGTVSLRICVYSDVDRDRCVIFASFIRGKEYFAGKRVSGVPN